MFSGRYEDDPSPALSAGRGVPAHTGRGEALLAAVPEMALTLSEEVSMVAARAFAERNVGGLDLGGHGVAGFEIQRLHRAGGDDGNDFAGGGIEDDFG